MKKLVTVMSVVLAFTLVWVLGCSKPVVPSPSPAAPKPAAPAPAPSPAAPKPAAPAIPASWPKTITMTLPSVGGSLSIYGVAVAKVMEAKLGIPTAPQHTSGTLEAASIMVKGGSQLTTPGAVLLGYGLRNAGPFANTKASEIMRGVTFGGYDTWLHWVVRADSNIKDFSDLKGKRAMAQRQNEPGFEDYRPVVLAAYGLTDKDLILMPDLGHSQQTAALKEGRADAALFFSAPPAPVFMELSQTVPIRVLSFSPEKLKYIMDNLTYSAYPATVPANTYKGQTEAATLLKFNMGVVARKDLPDDLVYAIAKAIDENIGEIRAVHAQFKNWTIQDLANSPHGPYHAGAFKYYTEKGYLTPESIAKHKEFLAKIGQSS